MCEVGWHGVILDSLHANEVVSQMWPHSLEVSVFSSRHVLANVSSCCYFSGIDVFVDLHVKGKESRLSLVLDETLDIFELLVLVVWTADGADLNHVAWFGLSDNVLSTEILVMDIFLIFAALMISSEYILLAMNSTALQ